MSLFSILGSTANTLAAYNKALNVSQNNVANVSTPGYARQTQTFHALSFDPANATTGGVAAGELQSSRDIYAEQNVRSQNSQLGTAEQQVASLTNLQSNFDLSGTTGIPAAFTGLFSAFSNWSVSPSDPTARQNVIQTAQNVAGAFQQASLSAAKIAGDSRAQLKGLVDQINSYAAQIQAANVRIQSGGGKDAALDADITSTLESLSEIADVTTVTQKDGTTTVLLGGQTTLVAGSLQYPISAQFSVPQVPPPTYPSAPPSAQILDASGKDITAIITDGKVAGILTVLNKTLPSVMGDAMNPGSLNTLAQSFADRVNTLLGQGYVSSGPPPQPGTPLFTYDTINGTNAAATLSLDPTATAAGLAAIDPGNPPATAQVSNGIALSLAGLASPTNPADQIQGQSYTQYFGSIARSVGTALSSALDGQKTQTSLVTQARVLRDQASGVSLDQEAVNVLELQRSFQAASKLFQVVDSLTQSILDLIR